MAGARVSVRASAPPARRATARPSATGRPLPAGFRTAAEGVLGTDLAHVRVHSDAEAHRLADPQRARAHAYRPHIVFGAGRYAPDTRDGRRLLAHELAHVLQ